MSFARYPSLEQAVVFVTGGASGIGAHMVRAFAEQGARVGFVDLAVEGGPRARGRTERRGREDPFRGLRPTRYRRAEGRLREAEERVGSGRGARQQRRARRPSRLGGGHAGILGRADRDQPPPHVLRDPDRRARHDRGRQGIDHQFRFEFMVAKPPAACPPTPPPRRRCTA